MNGKRILHHYFLRQSDGAAIAEELFQDVWLNLFVPVRSTRVARFSPFKWLAHNRLVDYYRRQSLRRRRLNDGAGPPLERRYQSIRKNLNNKCKSAPRLPGSSICSAPYLKCNEKRFSCVKKQE
jgi:DNA-directed RNA polymerase specialized sigma24 family protein